MRVQTTVERRMTQTEPVKTAVIYHYYDYNDNLDFFLKSGGLLNDENCDFFFICNKNENLIPEELTKGYSNVYFLNRENKNYDFGGYGELIYSDIFVEDKYDYFVFVNETACGPFLTPRDKKKPWYQHFTDRIDEKVKIFGASAIPFFGGDFQPHIQGWCFCLDKVSMNIAKASGVLAKDEDEMDKANMVFRKEVRLSQVLLENNFNIDCFNPHYTGVDWQVLDWNNKETQTVNIQDFPYLLLWGADPETILKSLSVRNESGYQCYDPFETIFIKRSKFHLTRTTDELFTNFYDRYRYYGQFKSLTEAAKAKLL